MSLSKPGPVPVLVGSILGITFSTVFLSTAMILSFLTVPTMLLPSPASPLPAPANAPNDASPTSTSSEKPATAPEHLARQWQMMYNLGKPVGAGSALLASGSFLYAMRHLAPTRRLQKRLLLLAAGLSVVVIPFTLTVMSRTNNELHRRAHAVTRGDDEDSQPKADAKLGTIEGYQTPDLVRLWAKLNTLRGTFHLGVIGCGIAALTL